MAERLQGEQPRKIPRGLAASIGCDIQTGLEQFRDGKMDREKILIIVRERVDAAMNTIAAREGYNPSTQKLHSKIVRDTCRTWFRELNGTYWTVEKNVPQAARKPWADYCHYSVNPSLDSEAGKTQAAKDFTAATGLDPEEVLQFKRSLGRIKSK